MLSTVKVNLSVNELRKTKNIYRNGEHQNHAKRYFLSDLKQEIDLQHDDEVEIENIEATLVQNYPSPATITATIICLIAQMTLLNLKKNIEKKSIIFSLKIKFANFYLHKVEVNKAGLKKLLQNGV